MSIPMTKMKINSSVFLVTFFLTVKGFLMQLVEMYILKSFYLACFCGFILQQSQG